MQGCQPAVETYLRDVALNFEETGFLTADILQIHCHLEQPIADVSLVREQLTARCREVMLEEIFQYRAHYELHRRSLIEKAQPVPAWSYHITFTDEQKQRLEAIYGDLLPGYIIYEERTNGTYKAAYRLERENLARLIQSRDLPFRIEIAQ